MKNKQNNYAFIDSQNVNLSIRDQSWVLDFKKFRIYLKDKYNINKAFLFIGFVNEYQDLYTSLQEFGYILVFKPTLKLLNGKALIAYSRWRKKEINERQKELASKAIEVWPIVH